MSCGKLRIAWSVFWGVACILMILLWVRSYSHLDLVAHGNSSVVSCVGEIDGDERFGLESGDDGPMNDSRSTLKIAGFEIGYLGISGFAVAERKGFASFRIPDWGLVTICVAIGATPWVCQRYSLRALLITTMLVAVILGLIVGSRR